MTKTPRDDNGDIVIGVDKDNNKKIIKREMLKLRMIGLDDYDKKKHNADFKIRLSRKTIEPIYTSNPIAEIHKYKPVIITIDPTYMAGEKVALYTNVLVLEDYIHEPMKSLEYYILGAAPVVDSILHFKRKW